MGFFDIFRKRDNEPEEPKNDTMRIDDVLLKALLDNETITRDKALTLPAVSGAVDLIANSIACMPVKLYRFNKSKASVEEVEDDARVQMLNGDTRDTLDAWQMKKAVVEDYLLGDGGYIYIERDRNDVTGLFYVEDRYISIMKTYEPIHKRYTILVEGYAYSPYEFIKILRNTKDGASGEGLTTEVSKAIEAAYHTLLYQLYLAKTGGNKKGFLKSQRKLGQDEIDVLKAAWSKLYANNSQENVIVLNNGLEFQEATSSSVEMQLNESKRTFDDQINGLFHIHPENFELTFKEAIYPIVKAFETALNRDLLLEKEKGKYFFAFDVKEIIKANITERYNAYKIAKDTGFMTINEIRRDENMNRIEGMDVVNVGLGAVLYNTKSQQFFTPNTGQTMGANGEVDNPVDNPVDTTGNPVDTKIQDMLEAHELVDEFDEDGNSSA